MTTENKTCVHCKNQFAIEPDDFTFYERIDVPAPEACPRCRQQRRIIFRNFKTFYKRNSDKTGKPMISMYPDRVAFPVWEIGEWWEDDWDPRDYGRDIDFNRPILEQFWELSKEVPHYGIQNTMSENCQYSNGVFESKNCYYIFGCVSDEQCAYGHIVWNSKDCFDNLYVYKSELCYECTDVLGSNRVLYSQECEGCADSVGLYDCKSCTNCIGCVGLRQKSYHIFNENVGKEGYEKFLKEHPLHNPETIQMIREKQIELRKKLPQRHFFGSRNDNVSGNHIYNSKNVRHAFDVKSGEDSKYIFTCRSAVNSYDISFTADVELGYYNLTVVGREVAFSHYNVNTSNGFYSEHCYNSHNIFACQGLRGNEYCILNKQYSKEEYEKLKDKLIAHMKKTGEWGKFFPVEMSPFAYNESIVQEYMPLTKEEALKQGFRWEDDIPRTSGQETIKHDALPQNPDEYSDDLLKETLKCDSCGHNYKLIQMEINFLKNMKLALPRECFNCRHQRRMDTRNPRTLWPGTCAKCEAKIETSYPPEKQSEFQIYCEVCYKQEMV